MAISRTKAVLSRAPGRLPRRRRAPARPRGTARRGAARRGWNCSGKSTFFVNRHRRAGAGLCTCIVRLTAGCAGMVQLCGPGAIQGAPAGPAGPAGIRAGPRVRLAKQFYPENPDIDAQGAYINTRSALFGDGVQLRGVGRPEAIQGAPAGPAGPAGVCTGSRVRFANNFTGKSRY